jgi:hypothetical protein
MKTKRNKEIKKDKKWKENKCSHKTKTTNKLKRIRKKSHAYGRRRTTCVAGPAQQAEESPKGGLHASQAQRSRLGRAPRHAGQATCGRSLRQERDPTHLKLCAYQNSEKHGRCISVVSTCFIYSNSFSMDTSTSFSILILHVDTLLINNSMNHLFIYMYSFRLVISSLLRF